LIVFFNEFAKMTFFEELIPNCGRCILLLLGMLAGLSGLVTG